MYKHIHNKQIHIKFSQKLSELLNSALSPTLRADISRSVLRFCMKLHSLVL